MAIKYLQELTSYTKRNMFIMYIYINIYSFMLDLTFNIDFLERDYLYKFPK